MPASPTSRAAAADTFFRDIIQINPCLCPCGMQLRKGERERERASGRALAPHRKEEGGCFGRSSRKQRRELKGAAPRASRIPRVPRQRCRVNRVPRSYRAERAIIALVAFLYASCRREC
jgi:hypothetical protein